MRKPIIAANWKMNKTLSEVTDFVKELKGKLPSEEKVDAVICAPSLFLKTLVDDTQDLHIGIGAENMHYEESGAFTGEISPVMLSDLGVHYVIVGHSERRTLFGETNDVVNKKMHAAFAHNLIPILCVGESLEVREAGKTDELVKQQVTSALAGLTAEQVKDAIIAYEPLWAIGTGKTASSHDAELVCAEIRNTVKDLYDEGVAEAIRIQYGGSVKPNNIEELLAETDIDGALVGGASLQAESFLQLLEARS